MVKIKMPALSLAEALVTMIIIMIAVTASVPILTKTKPKIDNTGIKGQYGCWYEPASYDDTSFNSGQPYYGAGQLVQWYFDERSPRTEKPEKVSSCTLRLDQKPSNFYILASGAGSSANPGQLVTLYTPALSSELSITIGKYGGSTTTTVTSADSANEVTASGGATYANGIVPTNIKSCKLILPNTACRNGSSGTPVDCEVVEVVQNGAVDYYGVRINGCEQDDEFGNPSDDHIFDLSTLTFYTVIDQSSSPLVANPNLDKLNADDLVNLSKPYRNRYNNGGNSDNRTRVAFEFYDSSYTSLTHLLDISNTQDASGRKNVSNMSRIIEDLPTRRQSQLTKLLHDLKPGIHKKNGAVLILW